MLITAFRKRGFTLHKYEWGAHFESELFDFERGSGPSRRNSKPEISYAKMRRGKPRATSAHMRSPAMSLSAAASWQVRYDPHAWSFVG